MKSMIYYPGFEIQNENWLKFALLYFDELKPIIPYMSVSENEYLTHTAIQVMHDTNLIRPYVPDYDEGYCASVLACEEFEKYLTHPLRYTGMFRRKTQFNIAEQWRQSEYQTYSLYNGKFSTVFCDYCIENELAKPFDYGIKISEDLAFVYMSLLADTISKKQEIEMFTDIRKYNNFLLSKDNQMSCSQDLKYKIIKTQMEFLIPAKISDIPLNTIIDLRSNRDFEFCRQAYVKEMEKYLDIRELNPNYSFSEQLRLKNEIVRIISKMGFGVSSVYLTCSEVEKLINGVSSPTMALASAIVNIVAIKEMYGMSEYIEDIKNKMQARRYLGQVRKVYRNHNMYMKNEVY